MIENTGYPRWIDPEGHVHLFMNCQNIEIADGGSFLHVDYFDKNPTASIHREFELDEEVSVAEAEKLVERWKQYLQTLVSAKPFPNTKDAQTAGCKCKIDYAHDPYCITVNGNSSIRATPDPLAPNQAPATNSEHLNDILADLVHRLMDQNVSMDNLVKALTPPPHQDPYYVPIPGFNNLADREPTPTERQCFLAGVMQFTEVLGNFNIQSKLEEFFDGLGVPTVLCEGCAHRVPLERAFRDDKGKYYGVDCCPPVPEKDQ
jgi:hypothetical protein